MINEVFKHNVNLALLPEQTMFPPWIYIALKPDIGANVFCQVMNTTVQVYDGSCIELMALFTAVIHVF
ncbi:hypothetical protein SADUNF_Sadunf09G0108100 [Salix dunnii]|uniref:Uncharacterized protein n=1 Tax=Salix dunnii TaxID=1413687 RepID=A0A835N0B4_9ROSI|nr:hypothetical protein SADUNF_Sadunf09G0108100 [Salix dunnii]